MSRSRAWKLQLNLDDFNAGFAALDTEAERSDFLLGLSRGMNNGKVKDDCSDPMSVGFCLGRDMRGEAESFMEASSLAGKRSAEAKSNKIQGPCQPPTQPPCQGSPNQSTIHNLNTKEASPAKKGRKAKAPKVEDQPASNMATLLSDPATRTAYWKLASAFGPTKNPAAKTTARLFVEAINSGADMDSIVNAGIALVSGINDVKFLPQLQKWLAEESYLTAQESAPRTEYRRISE